MTDTVIKQYLDAYEAAEKAHVDGVATLREKHEEHRLTVGYMSDEFYDEISKLDKTRRDSYREAWEMLNNSADPLVRFIHAECSEHQHEATMVIRQLPATYTELEKLANSNGWCDTWSDYLRRAVDAGVIELGMLSERHKIMMWLSRDYGMHHTSVSDAMKLVDAYADAAVDVALKAHGFQAVEAVVDPETVNVSQV